VDVTDPLSTPPALSSSGATDVDSNGYDDEGWYIQLATGEKVLAENSIFYKRLYITSFTPNNDPCLPGGVGKLYALNYLTGSATTLFSSSRSIEIGGGIPSKPVIVINASGSSSMFISVGSTNPDATSESFEAGILKVDPLAPTINFFYLWWLEL
jgi:type IV pilus assembly protein PilY1